MPLPAPRTGVPASPIVASSSVAGQCAAPRTGVDPDTGAAFPDQPARSPPRRAGCAAWIDETYLWFDEVPTTLAAADYATPIAYFNVLKTPKLTATGRAKDRFHFTQDTAAYRALSQGGIDVGYGVELAFLSASPPRDMRVAYTEPGSPAAQAAIERGTRLVEIDGVDVVNGTDTARLNAGLAPAREGEAHAFKLRAPDGSERTLTLTAARITPRAGAEREDHRHGERPGRLPALQRPPRHGRGAADRGRQPAQERRHRRPGDRHALQRRRPARHRQRAGLHGRLARRDHAARCSSACSSTTRTPSAWRPRRRSCLSMRPRAASRCRRASPCRRLGLSRVTVLAGPDTCSASESVRQQPARHRRHGEPGRRRHLRQALRLLPAGQLRHHLLRDPVPGRQQAGLRRLQRRLRARPARCPTTSAMRSAIRRRRGSRPRWRCEAAAPVRQREAARPSLRRARPRRKEGPIWRDLRPERAGLSPRPCRRPALTQVHALARLPCSVR